MKNVALVTLLGTALMASTSMAADTEHNVAFRFKAEGSTQKYILKADIVLPCYDSDCELYDTGEDLEISNTDAFVSKTFTTPSAGYPALANITITDSAGKKVVINKLREGEVKDFCSLDSSDATISTGAQAYGMVELVFIDTHNATFFACEPVNGYLFLEENN